MGLRIQDFLILFLVNFGITIKLADSLLKPDLSISVEMIGDDIFFEVVEPEDLRYTYRTRPARNFGPPFSTNFNKRQARLVPVWPEFGCVELKNADEIIGNIALVERGDCSFLSKAVIAEEAGARAVIITDYEYSDDDFYTEMVEDQTGRTTNIPATFLLGMNGYLIRKILYEKKLSYAVINIPVNVTNVPLNEWKQPPWHTW